MSAYTKSASRLKVVTGIAAAALALLAGPAQAEFPDKPIRFVVPFAAGSATDQLARAIGQAITVDAKVTVVVDNKPGANGFIAASDVAKASPDGYTVLISTNTTHAANEHLFKKLPYDPVKDYVPVTALGRGGQIMVVNPQLPVNNVGNSSRWRRRSRASSALAAAARPRALPGSCSSRWRMCSCCMCPTRATRWPSPTCWATRSR